MAAPAALTMRKVQRTALVASLAEVKRCAIRILTVTLSGSKVDSQRNLRLTVR